MIKSRTLKLKKYLRGRKIKSEKIVCGEDEIVTSVTIWRREEENSDETGRRQVRIEP